MPEKASVFVAGHRGLVGSAIVRSLQRTGLASVVTRTRSELDLTRQAAVDDFFVKARPAMVILAAAKVGGIHANTVLAADFIRENLLIETNVIDAAHRNGVRRFVFLGSSCIYPKMAPQPIREEHLLSGPLEPTNEAYAVAKIAGLKMCQYYRSQYGFDAVSLMPTNLYGPGDNFDVESSHVLPALIRKFHEAKVEGRPSVTIWGSGKPRREFLHVDDLADACGQLLFIPGDQIDSIAPDRLLNVGWGEDVTIGELAALVRDVVGARCELVFDATKPDGTPRKLLDSSRIRSLGWKPRISLTEGIAETYRWFVENRSSARGA